MRNVFLLCPAGLALLWAAPAHSFGESGAWGAVDVDNTGIVVEVVERDHGPETTFWFFGFDGDYQVWLISETRDAGAGVWDVYLPGAAEVGDPVGDAALEVDGNSAWMDLAVYVPAVVCSAGPQFGPINPDCIDDDGVYQPGTVLEPGVELDVQIALYRITP